MRRFIPILFIAILLLLSFCTVADAGPFRRRARNNQTQHHARLHDHYNDLRSYTRQDWDEVYPRYTGAFHARFFQHYGYPTGDIGLRGFAW